MVSSVNIAMPSISNDFTLSSTILNWIPLSFTLSMAIFVMLFGRLADIVGRKKVLLFGVILFTVSSLICAASINPVMLICARVQGVGEPHRGYRCFNINLSVSCRLRRPWSERCNDLYGLSSNRTWAAFG